MTSICVIEGNCSFFISTYLSPFLIFNANSNTDFTSIFDEDNLFRSRFFLFA